MLGLYAQRFTIVELDVTYYRVPEPKTVAAMAARTPAAFRFTAKLPGSATHLPAAELGRVHPDVAAFREAIAPLVDAERFAAALLQVPTSLRPSEAAYEHLAALREALDDVPLVAEFRHRAWQSDETLRRLEHLRIGLVNVDEPQFEDLMRPATDVTAPVAYLRFHGRNYKQWWKGRSDDRYDYEYTPDELEPWADRLVDVAAAPRVREVLAFFNNHRRGQAVRNAELFRAMVESRLPKGTVREPPSPPPTALSLFAP